MRLVPLKLHPGGTGGRPHVLHGRERARHHGGPLQLHSPERHRAQLFKGREARDHRSPAF